MFTFTEEDINRMMARAVRNQPQEVESLLVSGKISLNSFPLLISPDLSHEALKHLAEASFRATRKRFGYALSLYAPLYYDNRCVNGCLYCGFNQQNKIDRVRLSHEEIIRQAQILRKRKFKNILLVAGEHPQSSHPDFLVPVIRELHDIGFSCVSIEIAPLSEDHYRVLVDDAHLDGLFVYQETYNQQRYSEVHPSGPKKDFDHRLETAERGARAGIAKIGVGFLLGLHNWREEAVALAMHLDYLQKHHWQAEYSVSFPRIRHAEGMNLDLSLVRDRDFIQLVCALRLLFPEAGMSLSTREEPGFRDKITPLGFTALSAGSSTAPGGYDEEESDYLSQFHVEDDRSPSEIATMLSRSGFDPVWKDFE